MSYLFLKCSFFLFLPAKGYKQKKNKGGKSPFGNKSIICCHVFLFEISKLIIAAGAAAFHKQRLMCHEKGDVNMPQPRTVINERATEVQMQESLRIK